MPKEPTSEQVQAMVAATLGAEAVSERLRVRGGEGTKYRVRIPGRDDQFLKLRYHDAGAGLPDFEEQVLARVQSDRVIKPTFHRSGDWVLILQPFIDGRNIAQVVADGPMGHDELRRLATELIEAVGAVQTAGALHLDIKTANVMELQGGGFALVDFGTARFIEGLRALRLRPARGFLAPEILQFLQNQRDENRQHISVSADMHGVGGVLYVAATGAHAAGIYEHSDHVYNRQPAPVREVRPDLPADLAALIDQLLEKKPQHRLNPDAALRLLRGEPPPNIGLPPFLLKPGTGDGPGAMLDTVVELNDSVGVYYRGNRPPEFPYTRNRQAGTQVRTLLWEMPEAMPVARALEQQFIRGATVLIIPNREMVLPFVAENLATVAARVREGVAWRDQNAPHKKVFAVLPIEIPLLASGNEDAINATLLHLEGVDGIVLRLCAPDFAFAMTGDHLTAVRSFIAPWKTNGKTVLIDGDLSVLPVFISAGADGIIASEFPRLPVLLRVVRTPGPRHLPTGIYLPHLMCRLKEDEVIQLRAATAAAHLLTCTCPGCAPLRVGPPVRGWERRHWREHFLRIFPGEIERVVAGSEAEFRERIASARAEALRFPRQYGMRPPSQDHFDAWDRFLRP